MASKELSINEMNLTISAEMITRHEGITPKKVYLLWDISGSMRTMKSVNINDYVEIITALLVSKGVEPVFVPFGDYPKTERAFVDGMYINNPVGPDVANQQIAYTSEAFLKVKKAKVGSTDTYLLSRFFKETDLEELYGIYFFGDGHFTDYRDGVGDIKMKHVLCKAYETRKLRNCAFVHCVYPKHTTMSCIASLNTSVQQILSMETTRAIYFSHYNLQSNSDRTFNMYGLNTPTCAATQGYFTVGNYTIPSWMVPSNIASLISKHYPDLVFVTIKSMINALKTNIELFLIKDSAYSRMHRVLSIIQKVSVAEFFGEDLLNNIMIIDAEWEKYWSLGDSDPTELRIEDIYFKVFDTWKTMNPKYTNHCNQLAMSAFGSEMEKSFNRFIQQRNASHIVIYDGASIDLPTNIVQLYEFFIDFFTKKRITIVKNTEKNRQKHWASILTYLNTDPAMAWTSLKFFFDGRELNKIKAFFLGIAISNFTEEYPELQCFLKARRFTDPYVCEGSFKNPAGAWQSEIFKAKLAIPLYEFIQKNMDVEKFSFINEVLAIVNMSNKFGFLQNLFIKMKLFLRKMVARRAISNASPHLGTWIMLKSHFGDFKPQLPGLVYVRKYKITGMSVQYIDQHMTKGAKPSCFNGDNHSFVGTCVIDYDTNVVTHNDRIIGEVIPLAKLDISSQAWKSLGFVKALNQLLMDNFYNYADCNYDSVYAKIIELLTVGEAEINKTVELVPTMLMFSDILDMFPVLSPSVVAFLKTNPFQQNMPIGAYYEFVKTTESVPTVKEIIDSMRIHLQLVTMDDDEVLQMKALKRLISKSLDELHEDFENECIFCEDTLNVLHYEIPHKCGHIDKVCKDCYTGMKKTVHQTIGEGGRVPVEMITCCMCRKGSLRKANILFGPWRAAVIQECKTIKSTEKMYFCCGNDDNKHGFHGCPHKNVVSVEIGCVAEGVEGGIFKCDQCLDEDAMDKPVFLIKCPHCDNFLQHLTGCNLMLCCQYGAHAHDLTDSHSCHGCGHATDFCGGEFRLDEEIQDVIGTVTSSYNFNDYMEIGLESLYVMTRTDPLQYNGWCLTTHGMKYLSGELSE
jgi:hypothetical protein